MDPIFPSKLKAGDEIRVVAPSRSLHLISPENRIRATRCLETLGVKVTFGKNVEVCDLMLSSSVAERVQDLHEAFEDPNVKGILTVIGGYNCNQLLDALDYNRIAENPKIFCGFSDITALNNALFKKAGLVTYSGPHFSSFAMEKGLEYTLDSFKKIFFEEAPLLLSPCAQWSQDPWYRDQDTRTFYANTGYQVLNPGNAQGRLVGGNLGTFHLLRGTPYGPDLEDTILFLEEVSGMTATVEHFDRWLQALTQDPCFSGVRALVLGRFENSFGMTSEKLNHVISTKPALGSVPVIAGVDFGHTTPIITFPIGGVCTVQTHASGHVQLRLTKH